MNRRNVCIPLLFCLYYQKIKSINDTQNSKCFRFIPILALKTDPQNVQESSLEG
jgi:hypothetical protein